MTEEGTTPEAPLDPREEARKRALETERIQELRERLYARGSVQVGSERHSLKSDATPLATPPDVNRSPAPTSVPPVPSAPYAPEPLPQTAPQGVEQNGVMTTTRTRKKFRSFIALLGVLFFIAALGVSSFYLFIGGNTISGNNITVSTAGPLAVGGGENLSFQIAIANQNTLPIESATLIIEYPKGAQSPTEAGKVLYSERQQLNNIDAGEAVNVPVHVLIFGEENEEKIIDVAVEYRVKGSNATFYKEAEPYHFKISSSPVVVSVNAVKTIPSGQETGLEVIVQSNSPTVLNNILLKATYPDGFDFTSSKPETASGQDTWNIKALKPGEKQTITIKGVVVGEEQVPERFEFAVGVANERDAFTLVSPLMSITHDMEIEKPFLDVSVNINGETGDPVIISTEEAARVNITFKNILETVMYDGAIRVELDGNALDEVDVRVDDGHYDSLSNTITWDAVGVKELRELGPGASHVVSFTLDPRDDVQSTPEVTMHISIEGNRVLEDRATEKVVGTVSRTVKVASVASLKSSALYTGGPFTNTGPVPPVAEKTTQYSFLLAVDNSTNEVSGAEVTAVLPQYITWLDLVSDGDDVTYTPSTRTLKWNIGGIESGGHEEVWIQVAFTPSLSQVGLTPTLLETQRFKAVDRFTGTVIRDDASALTTSLINDTNQELRDGRVQEAE